MARPIRVAAAGDIHCSSETKDRLAAAFERVESDVDMFLLAGDLTTLGEPEQAEALADICRDLEPRVVAVLGNHDWHANRVDEIVAALEGAGVTMLNPGTTTCAIYGLAVGAAATRGFVGAFPLSPPPDSGEPILRQVYRDTTAEVEAIDSGLEEISGWDIRADRFPYAPMTTTLEGGRRV